MNPFRMLPDATLQSRVTRLKREEQDLAERVARQLTALEAGNTWHKSDPLYQRLSSVLTGIREDLRKAEKELTRRAEGRFQQDISAGTNRAPHASYAQRVVRFLEGLRATG